MARKTQNPNTPNSFYNINDHSLAFQWTHNYVHKILGNTMDPRDIFQSALERYFINLQKDPPEKIEDPDSYLFGIARKLIFKELERRQKEREAIHISAERHKTTIDDKQEAARKEKQRRLIYKNMRNLTYSCLVLLKIFLLNISNKIITQLLKFKSNKIASNRMNECIRRLKTLVSRDKEFITLLNDE